MPTGKEKRVPVDSQNIRPRLYALPERQDAEAQRTPASERRQRGREGRRRNPQGRVEGDSRDRPGPDRSGADGVDSAHQLLDPAGRPRRAADRPEADPRRLEAARGDGDLPRQRQEPLRRRTSAAPASCCSPRRRCSSRVLADEQLEIYDCGRTDIATGQIDRRVLAMLEYLVSKGFT